MPDKGFCFHSLNSTLQVKNLIKLAKQSYYAKQIALLSDPDCTSKCYWKIVKDLYGARRELSIPTLVDNGCIFATDQGKAEVLNNYFASQSTLPDPPDEFCFPEPSYLTKNRLSNLELSAIEVRQALLSLKVGKASGYDGLSNRLLKQLSPSLTYPLTRLYNLILSQGEFPSSWKYANISAVFKKGDTCYKGNYRPISLLPCIGKVLEKLVFNHLYVYCCKNQLLTERNSGFRPKDSTVNQILHLVHNIYNDLDNKRDVCLVFLDISKAFDRVCHEGLLLKLTNFGVSGRLLQFLKSYLTQRYQRVVLNGKSSTWLETNAGVPQGSILGPLLFLVYINDLVGDLESTPYLYADDTALKQTVTNPAIDFELLNRDLIRISKWAKQWRVTFNELKSKFMYITLKPVQLNLPILRFNEIPLDRVYNHCHLGIYLNSSLSWGAHVSTIVKKAMNRISSLKKVRHLLPRSVMENLYKTIIKPVLEYGSVVYDNLTKQEAQKLEAVQRAAAVLCTGANIRTKTHILLSELGWNSLSSHRKYTRLVTFYKMKNLMAPKYLCDLFPDQVVNRTLYNLRSVNQLVYTKCRLTCFKNSFIPATTLDWNNLDLCTQNARSLNEFKSKIKLLILPSKPNKLYSQLNHPCVKYHTQLRTGLSGLRAHLFKYNIVDDPLCLQCLLSPETTEHYLLKCHTFAPQRAHLLRHLNDSVDNFVNMSEKMQITLMLQGSENLTFDENIRIFNYVISFIAQTGRLSGKTLNS